MNDVLSFGMWIRRRRKAIDLTQAELATRVGCATQTIKMYNHHIDMLRTALGDTAFATAWAAGEHLTADQALDAAQGILTQPSP